METTQENSQALYQAILDNANNDRNFFRFCGMRCTRLEKLYCEGEMPITPDTLNRWGCVHGGCLVTLADTVAGVAASTIGKSTLTLNHTFNFLRPGKGSKIKCVAEAVKVGKTVTVMRATLTDDQDRTIATGDFTFFYTGEFPVRLTENAQTE